MPLEPFIAEIMPFAADFPPRSWAACNGQLLSISQNQALFSLIGTIYGGNGTTNFALPDLRGRVPIHFGQGPGLAAYTQGQAGGTENTTLQATNLPAHSHPFTATAAMPCRSGAGSTDNPTGAIPAGSAMDENYAAPNTANGTMAPINMTGSTGQTGAGQPFNNVQPYLVLNFCIALQGIFPSRN